MTISISDRAAAIGESQTLAISARAKQMQKEGVDVIGFGAGEPDFPTPAHIVDAAEKAMRDGATRYTPASGTPELKEAAAVWLEKESGVKYAPSQVIVSCGAKHSLYNLMQVLFQEGNQVLLPAPYWVTYPEQIRLAGAEPVVLDTEAEAGFRITADQLKEKITPNSRGLVLNSPCNPTGALYSRKELEEIAAVCVENGLVVISDEIYSRLVYGWRIGFAAGPEHAMKAMGRLQSQSTSNPTAVAQAASLAALNGDQDIVEEMRHEFDARRRLMTQKLKEIPGVACGEPQGAFYCFPSVKGLLGKPIGGVDISGSSDLARECLAKANVAVVPGKPFGADEFLRLSYATSRDNIEQGIRRLREFVSSES
jgi:aspartate aminotransferase